AMAMAFVPPDRQQRLAAIGPAGDLPPVLRRAFEPAEGFDPIPPPGPNDWLSNHAEEGQTFEQFAGARRNTLDARRNKLYLLPLGDFPPDRSPPLDKLREFAAAFFMMDVEVLRPLDLSSAHVTSRRNPAT